MSVKFKLSANYKGEKPKRGTEGSAGFDMCAQETVTVYPGQVVIVRSGLFVEIPIGWVGIFKGRSGLAFKHKIESVHDGVIDSDYRGEIAMMFQNISYGLEPCEGEQGELFPENAVCRGEPYTIHAGDRVGQLVVMRTLPGNWVEVKELGDTDRGFGGFGSTGK